ncbi:hypothetical protein HZH66_010435 [Vespula vulgaris]|uniref:Uncharacterized protein n=1 Tax=Vespula vulgaris TaxID=7454 RepID=A0A834N054_VESVU|nr:hypothetical protein HZH66_010435 [Vespula vulgaris]
MPAAETDGPFFRITCGRFSWLCTRKVDDRGWTIKEAKAQKQSVGWVEGRMEGYGGRLGREGRRVLLEPIREAARGANVWTEGA